MNSSNKLSDYKRILFKTGVRYANVVPMCADAGNGDVVKFLYF